jgi:DNA-binding XRE family transcriptional regulator
MNDRDTEWHRSHGYDVTDASQWLGLTPEEDLVVQFRVRLTLMLKRRRTEAGITQAELGARIGTSQSRVAFMEQNSKNVSSDLLIKAIAATGAQIDDIARAFAER